MGNDDSIGVNGDKKPAAVELQKVVTKRIDWSAIVHNTLQDDNKVRQFQNANCPLPICAVVNYLAENIFPKRLPKAAQMTPSAQAKLESCANLFDKGTMSFTLPVLPRNGQPIPSSYHMIESQAIIYVAWEIHFPGLRLACPHASCSGELQRDRTNWSVKKKLFPVFRMGGPPSWAVVMKYQCPLCKASHWGNSPTILGGLPHWAQRCYPIDPKYIPKETTAWHLHQNITDLFESLMVTYANGDVLARMIYRGINKSYVMKTADFFSYHAFLKKEKVAGQANGGGGIETPAYPTNPDNYCPCRPPTGDEIRELFLTSQHSTLTLSGISDFERLTREMQSVSTSLAAAQDHTADAAKNDQCQLGGNYIWNCVTETGEVASAVLVP